MPLNIGSECLVICKGRFTLGGNFRAMRGFRGDAVAISLLIV